MSRRGPLRLGVPVVTLALLVALTGCGKPGAHPGTGPVGATTAGSPTTSASATAADSAALDGISRDLDSVDTANTEAGSNADAGDQAAATGDEP